MSFPADQVRWDIRRRGRPASLVRKVVAAANPARPYEGVDPAAQDIKDELTVKLSAVSQKDVDGDRVLESDQVVSIYAPDITGRAPQTGDLVIVDGSTFSVKGSRTKERQGVALRYDLRVRR